MKSTTISLAHARRIAIRAQALDGSADGILDTVRRLGSVQLDPIARVAPTHLLVLWSRLGRYDRAELERLLWDERALFEYAAFVWPAEDFPLVKRRMRRYLERDTVFGRRVADWIRANDSFRRYVLRELRRRGPLRSAELEDRSVVPWPSSGWTANQNVTQMLGFLHYGGRILVAGRRKGQRLWDLADRVLPAGLLGSRPAPPRALDARRLQALGIVRPRALELEPPWAVRVRVEGVEGEWLVDRERLEDASGPRRTTFLSPFDRLIHDRERTEELFGFHYRMEIYVPKARRRHGYYVLPILQRDRLVGRIDPEFDREAGVLRVNAVYWEPGVDAVSLGRPLRDLAAFLGADRIEMAS